MSKKFKINVFWPILFLILILFVLNLTSHCYAEDSSRPPSVFSICCCSKQNDDGLQIIYSCKYLEYEKCPINTKQYKSAFGDCPSNLMFTKYIPEQNQDSKDN